MFFIYLLSLGQIVQSVKASMSKTLTMFGQLYQRLALLAHAPVRQLFDRLERFVSKSGGEEDPADVSDAVAAFFDDLFPRLHGQSPRTVNQGPPLPANTLGLKLNQVPSLPKKSCRLSLTLFECVINGNSLPALFFFPGRLCLD